VSIWHSEEEQIELGRRKRKIFLRRIFARALREQQGGQKTEEKGRGQREERKNF